MYCEYGCASVMAEQHLVSTCCSAYAIISACTSEMTSLILVLVPASKPLNIEIKIVFTFVLALLVKTRCNSQSCLRVSAEFLEIEMLILD